MSPIATKYHARDLSLIYFGVVSGSRIARHKQSRAPPINQSPLRTRCCAERGPKEHSHCGNIDYSTKQICQAVFHFYNSSAILIVSINSRSQYLSLIHRSYSVRRQLRRSSLSFSRTFQSHPTRYWKAVGAQLDLPIRNLL